MLKIPGPVVCVALLFLLASLALIFHIYLTYFVLSEFDLSVLVGEIGVSLAGIVIFMGLLFLKKKAYFVAQLMLALFAAMWIERVFSPGVFKEVLIIAGCAIGVAGGGIYALYRNRSVFL